MSSPAYVVKSPRAASLGREVRELVRQVAPEAPVYRDFTMEFLAQRSMVQLSFTLPTADEIDRWVKQRWSAIKQTVSVWACGPSGSLSEFDAGAAA